MNTALARFLSFVLHPLLIPTVLFGIIFYAATPAVANLAAFNGEQTIDFFGIKLSFRAGLLLLVFFFTFLIPSYLLYVLYRLKVIKSLTMENLQDRRLPYLVIVMLYTIFSYASFRYMALLPEVTVVMASITFSISCVAFISLYWQISAHATGMGGVLGGLLALTLKLGLSSLLIPFLIVTLLTGFLMSARLYLNAHTPRQILVGLLLGAIVCGTTFYIFI
ncbi:phosphatase PAP2 family protein [Siphonobacter sp. SORGH_AS_0500]|uniref:phosphatase PAP2 family protein n=1 Tax=Siphonobacter sp. SORGH_AS_0500 TaxID=1864824 RepID=UPI002863F851|nr:phosphatase PAP2 family protein [Siphonobacter sp. SORGH_AS_0500]MDR6194410.1 membrane-associated phospholipid phosphatase [Siphonobacter sp. SORGH_AS_0500]